MSENDNKNSLNSLEEFDKSIEKEELRSFDKKESGNPLNSLEDLNKSIKPESLRKFNEANGIKEKAEVVKEEVKEQVKEQVKKEVKSVIKKKLLLLLKPLIVPLLYIIAGIVLIITITIFTLMALQAMVGGNGRESELEQTAMVVNHINQTTTLFSGYKSDVPYGAPMTGYVNMYAPPVGNLGVGTCSPGAQRNSFYNHMCRGGASAGGSVALDIHGEFTEKVMEEVTKFSATGEGNFENMSQQGAGQNSVILTDGTSISGSSNKRREFLEGLIKKYGLTWDFSYYVDGYMNTSSSGWFPTSFNPLRVVKGGTRTHSSLPVFSTLSGKVVFADDGDGTSGGALVIRGEEYAIGLYHNSRIMVQKGAEVGAGQLVSIYGTRGYSTGPHLHYEIGKVGGQGGIAMGYGKTGLMVIKVEEFQNLMSFGTLIKKGEMGYFNHVGTNMASVLGQLPTSGAGAMNMENASYDFGDSETGFVEGDKRSVPVNGAKKVGLTEGAKEGGAYKLGLKRFIKQNGGIYTKKVGADYYTRLYTDAGFSKALAFTKMHREGGYYGNPEEEIGESWIYKVAGDGGIGPTQNQHPSYIENGLLRGSAMPSNPGELGRRLLNFGSGKVGCNWYAGTRGLVGFGQVTSKDGAEKIGCLMKDDLRMNPNYQPDIAFNLIMRDKVSMCSNFYPDKLQKLEDLAGFDFGLCLSVAFNGLTEKRRNIMYSTMKNMVEDVKSGSYNNFRSCVRSADWVGCEYALQYVINFLALQKDPNADFHKIWRVYTAKGSLSDGKFKIFN